ncbi:hypothetical protein CMK19_01210 [Candidatus Poribacteria bacterium]|nr:hypothetical protein [Candidatus Poribacteria bacterium]
MAKDMTTSMERLDSIKKKVDTFSEILDTLNSTEEKKKLLWKEIYENAIADRENAAMLFTDAWKNMQGGTSEHISLGTTMSKYLERMCKSNEQILRLAELITKAEEKEASIDSDDLFAQIDNGKG